MVGCRVARSVVQVFEALPVGGGAALVGDVGHEGWVVAVPGNFLPLRFAADGRFNEEVRLEMVDEVRVRCNENRPFAGATKVFREGPGDGLGREAVEPCKELIDDEQVAWTLGGVGEHEALTLAFGQLVDRPCPGERVGEADAGEDVDGGGGIARPDVEDGACGEGVTAYDACA